MCSPLSTCIRHQGGLVSEGREYTQGFSCRKACVLKFHNTKHRRERSGGPTDPGMPRRPRWNEALKIKHGVICLELQ